MGHSLGEAQSLEDVCVIGLGYVGLTLAVSMADAGYRVYGVERNRDIRDCIDCGRAHFFEPGLDESLARHVAEGRIICTAGLPPAEAVSVYIITVGTPLTAEGTVNLGDLENVLEEVAGQLREGDAVILRSTVKNRATREIAKPILDTAGVDYDLAFCPERTLEGKALRELRSLPQVVGGLDRRAVERAACVFGVLAPRIIRVNCLEEAEMVKLLNNTQRDLMFAFANEVGEMCDSMGVSATSVIRAACEDYPRSQIPLPGPVGGPCLEKDPHILAEGLRESGYVPRVSLAGRHLNEELPRSSIARIAAQLASIGVPHLGNGAKVVILGLAFKGQPETNDLRGTMARPILKAARGQWPEASFHGFDPVVDRKEYPGLGLEFCASLEEAFEGASLVLIQNNHRQFAEMPLESLMGRMAYRSLVFDYWNLFDPDTISPPAGRYYGGLGTMARVKGSLDSTSAEQFPVADKAGR